MLLFIHEVAMWAIAPFFIMNHFKMCQICEDCTGTFMTSYAVQYVSVMQKQYDDLHVI